jgi:hypothetical protein
MFVCLFCFLCCCAVCYTTIMMREEVIQLRFNTLCYYDYLSCLLLPFDDIQDILKIFWLLSRFENKNHLTSIQLFRLIPYKGCWNVYIFFSCSFERAFCHFLFSRPIRCLWNTHWNRDGLELGKNKNLSRLD